MCDFSSKELLNCHLIYFFLFFSDNLSKKFGTQINDIFDTFGSDFSYPGNLPAYVEEYFEENGNTPLITGSDAPPGKIQCLPAPGKR